MDMLPGWTRGMAKKVLRLKHSKHMQDGWSPLDFRQKQQDVYDDRETGTGKWFLVPYLINLSNTKTPPMFEARSTIDISLLPTEAFTEPRPSHKLDNKEQNLYIYKRNQAVGSSFRLELLYHNICGPPGLTEEESSR